MKRKVNSIAIALLSSVVPTIQGAEFLPVQAEELFAKSSAVSSAWGDYDNDQDLDLAVVFVTGEVRLYQNNKGNFSNLGVPLGLPLKGGKAMAVVWGDYDNDGDLDLLIGYKDRLLGPQEDAFSPAKNRLFQNQSGKGFTEVTKEVDLNTLYVSSRGMNWIDYDNDGDLDLFSAQRKGKNLLYKNTLGKFEEVSKVSGLADIRRTVGSCWFDMDKDGDLDLFNANQNGDRDAFYRNDAGTFVDIATELAMDKPRRPINKGSVSCSVADYDNDGHLDLFVGSLGGNSLYRNLGDGHFTDVAASQGLSDLDPAPVGFSSWGDYDLDGRIDLYIANAYGRDYLLRNTAAGFVDQLPKNMLKKKETHSVQWGDFDLDGDLDLALASVSGEQLIRRNTLDIKNRSLQILVLDDQGHYTKAGSEVRLYDSRTRKLLGTRIVETGGGYNAQSAIPVHFAVPKGTKVDVEVTAMTQDGRLLNDRRDIDPIDFSGRAMVVRMKL